MSATTTNAGQASHGERMTRSLVLDALAQALNDAAVMAGDPTISPLAETVLAGAETVGSPACRRALFALSELPPAGGEDLRRRFERIANRPDARPLPLSESLALYGRLIGPAIEQVSEHYRQFGLEPDGDLPDSASTELAFLAFLVEAEAEAQLLGKTAAARRLRRQLREFLNEHVLAWLPQVGRALAHSGDAHFVMVGQLLEDFLKEEQLRVLISRKGRAQADVPFIAAAEDCGLCGFCVQSCPTGALWISENEAATHLVLKPENCIGCAKCLPVCPDSALSMVSRPDDLAQTVVVRQSPRARCPRCGEPTVSEAEMASVFARLEADDKLRYRLSLCNACKALM